MAFCMSLGERIRLARKRKKLSQTKLAELVGVSQATVADWERGETMPGRHRIPKLSEVLQVAAEWLELGLSAQQRSISTAIIPVIGQVQAGAWVESMEWPNDQWQQISVPPDERYPDFKRYGLKVAGPSMDQVLAPGSIAICIRLGDLARMPRPGEYVVVQRTRPDGLTEATIKEFLPDQAGNVWLWPRSNHPDHKTPIRLEPNGEDNSVEVIAVVVGAYRPL